MYDESNYLSSQLLIGEQLKSATLKTPHHDGFIDKEQRVTFKEMNEKAIQLSSWLIDQGIQLEDKIGILMKNSLPFIEVFYGIAYAGGTGVPINFRLEKGELSYILNNADVKILFIERQYFEIIESIKDELVKVEKIVVIDLDDLNEGFYNYEDIFQLDVKQQRHESISENNVALILYTSGTTGKPKGAVITHRSLCTAALNMAWEWDADMYGVTLGSGPFFHVGGINRIIINCMISGTLVICKDFNPIEILEGIEKEKINVVSLVPTAWRYLLQVPNITDYDLSSVTICVAGASPVPLELKKQIKKVFNHSTIIITLGSTETSTAISNLKGEDVFRKENSVGKPIISLQVRIVDENMNDVPIGEVGELVYRGPILMEKYYNNPEATNEAFKGGWFHGGDLGKMDNEGYIYLVDRKKDVIISGGENIYPAELEYILEQHEAIQECAVVGIPDLEWGESVMAFIVLKNGMTLEEKVILDYCKTHLASYKKPKYIQFIKSLPKNGSGKVLKNKLKEKINH